MPRHLLRAVFLLALFAGTLGVAAPALAVDTPFTVRYAQTLRGSINAVGNQLLTCPAAATGCTDARNRVGTSTTLNNNYNMGYVDVDGDASTLNSSTATLALPAGATVTWAGLYWGADTAAGTGGSVAPDRRQPRLGALQGRRGRLPDGDRGARRRADLHREGHALPRLRQRHGPAAGRRQRHVHRGQRPDRPRRRPLRGLVARRRLPGRRRRTSTGSASTTASARSTPRTPSPPTSRPSTRPATRHGGHQDRPARVRGRHRHRRRDGDVQRDGAHRRDQRARQPHELDDGDRRGAVRGQEPELRQPHGHGHRRLEQHRAASPTTRARRRSPSRRTRTCSCRRRCGWSPTRARPPTPPARRSAAWRATARR